MVCKRDTHTHMHASSSSSSFSGQAISYIHDELKNGYRKEGSSLYHNPHLLHTSNMITSFSHLPFAIANSRICSYHWCGSCIVLSCLSGRRAHHSPCFCPCAHPTRCCTKHHGVCDVVVCIFILLHNNNNNTCDYPAYQFTLFAFKV